jgi:acetyl/propionyl-CoA carboxylase alpha subunit
MNTRLRVEPVTEIVTGLDLVELQVRIARGEPLPLRQEDVRLDGHAIEARLYAEAPHKGFLPQSGTLVAWRPPAGAGIRVDHGLRDGQAIGPYYDPLLAMIIAHGATRAEARARLECALEATPRSASPPTAASSSIALAMPSLRAAATTQFIPSISPVSSSPRPTRA